MEPALEGSQKDQWQQDHWTKATSTTTALVEDELGDDGNQNAREVIAGAREQIDITSKLVEAKMKTTVEPHVKRNSITCRQGVGQAGSSSRTTLPQ